MIFLTKEYIQKVNHNDKQDLCHCEFSYAFNKKPTKCIIPVIFDDYLLVWLENGRGGIAKLSLLFL